MARRGVLALAALVALSGANVRARAAAAPGGQRPEEADVYTKTICAIARSIEGLKAEYPQLAEFSAAGTCDGRRLHITYGYRTEPAPRTGGWTSGVPSPTDDGVWLYVDVHPADSTAQIHTQPVVPRYRFKDRRVMLLLREGARTKALGGALVKTLRDHGVQPLDP